MPVPGKKRFAARNAKKRADRGDDAVVEGMERAGNVSVWQRRQMIAGEHRNYKAR